jgi:hypothetical protein
MAVRIYYVVTDGSNRWGVRRDEAHFAASCRDREDAVITARRYAARDHRNGDDAQVQIQTAQGFELDWRRGQPVEQNLPGLFT